MTRRYRADQVGSLLRPPKFLEARAAHAQGHIDLAALRQFEDQAILDVLELQRQTGMDVFTDGEHRRTAYMTNMTEAVEGFVSDRVEVEWHGPGGRTEPIPTLAEGAPG